MEDKLIKNSVIFSGSKDGDGAYLNLAYELGEKLASNGFTVVNGGGPGLMDKVAKGAFENGGKVVGVHWQIDGRELSRFNTETLTFSELRPRQNKLLSLADAYIALPGGIGTVFELYEILVKKYLGEIEKDTPIFLLGKDFWENFVLLAEKQITRGFVEESFKEYFTVVDSVAEVLFDLNNSNNK
ncbi:MAG: TIGR00730 family Rossman fold protein [Candidatus Vogelbacteria bacterium]|nr:TIGR00730 family Rossman fold protein [Candidatus Vogelbacteria bacterium]